MGWEGLYLYEFRIRLACYGSPDLSTGAADVTAFASMSLPIDWLIKR